MLVALLLALTAVTDVAGQKPARTAATNSKPFNYVAANTANYLSLAGDMDVILRRDVLGVWFPRSIDKQNGGFYSSFTPDWRAGQSEGKFSVFQGRMTWLAAQIVMRRPDLKEQFLPAVQHGVQYLSNVMWDKRNGGFFWGLDDKGQISPRFSDGKHLYGMSFCLYGAAAAYQARHDPSDLELAQRSFRWMDQHAHDSRNGGYFEWLTREGKVVEAAPNSERIQEVIGAGFPIGYKSMNTHIHLLESFTQLYEVWQNQTLRQRLGELLEIIRDKICVEPGAMNLYFTNDWRAFPDHDSYGHDIETAYLMLESANRAMFQSQKTESMAKLLVDHALAYGWDEENGGFYREGTTYGKPEDLRKEWWAQFEGLNSLLLMHEKYGRNSDKYWKAFLMQWQFIKDKQVDHEFGGIYDTVERDGTATNRIKARMWKEAYHDGRSLLNVTERLRRLAKQEKE